MTLKLHSIRRESDRDVIGVPASLQVDVHLAWITTIWILAGARGLNEADSDLVGGSYPMSRGDQFAALARFRRRGRRDRSFGQNGFLRIDPRPSVVASDMSLDRRGRIMIAAGQFTNADPSTERFSVLRRLPNGLPDRGFFGDGTFNPGLRSGGRAEAVITQRDGRVVFGGKLEDAGTNVLVRLLAD